MLFFVGLKELGRISEFIDILLIIVGLIKPLEWSVNKFV